MTFLCGCVGACGAQVRLLADREKGNDDEGSYGFVLILLRFFRDKGAAEELRLPLLQEKQLRDSDDSVSGREIPRHVAISSAMA